jgi:hypothetical protein
LHRKKGLQRRVDAPDMSGTTSKGIDSAVMASDGREGWGLERSEWLRGLGGWDRSLSGIVVLAND